MIGSLNKALLALLLSASAALAAPGAPHSTGPLLEEGAVDDNGQVAIEPGAGGISESSMNAPPIDGFGTLEQGKGALPDDVWRGSTRAFADPLLRELRTGVANAGIKDLLVRLLMSPAAPPQGNAQPSWFVVRVNALIGIGEDAKAEQMVASLPASMKDPSFGELEAGLELTRGEYDHACQKAQPGALPTDSGNDAFWHKLSILCQAHAGKQEEALVGIDLMREERHTDDTFFQEVIRRIGDRNYIIKDNPKQWTLLNVALLRLANDTERLKGYMEMFPPIAVKYMAQDDSLDTTLREKAATRAQQLGVLPGGDNNKVPEQPFSRPLASDVTTLVAALGSGKPANGDDNAVIERLALDEAGVQDSRRVQRLLTFMEPFGFQVPPQVWEKLFMHRERFDGSVPPASLVARINDAAQAGRRGEVIVLSALITGGDDAGRASDLALLPVVKALMAAGFDKEARMLAHDAVKGYSAR